MYAMRDPEPIHDAEMFVRFEESVRGCDVFILQTHTDPLNKWIMEQLIMVDAAKRASAKRIAELRTGPLVRSEEEPDYA